MSKQSARKNRAVKFLRERPQLWGASDREIVGALKGAGIVARGTYYEDVSVRALLREAQTVRPVRPVRVPRPRCPTCNQVLPRVPAPDAVVIEPATA
jgi:hypothetical protein